VTSCSKQCQRRDQTRLLRAVSSLVFKASKEGECTNSLGSLSYPETFHGRQGIQKMSGMLLTFIF